MERPSSLSLVRAQENAVRTRPAAPKQAPSSPIRSIPGDLRLILPRATVFSIGRGPRLPGSQGARSTVPTGRHYRTKVEVLRDLLEATRQQEGKTRIIGRANLNEISFERYALLALTEGLLARAERGFRITPLGEAWVGAANRMLTKQDEFQRALKDLTRLQAPHEGPRSPGLLVRDEMWALKLLPAPLRGVELAAGSSGISGGHRVMTPPPPQAPSAALTEPLGAPGPASPPSAHARPRRGRFEGTIFDTGLLPK